MLIKCKVWWRNKRKIVVEDKGLFKIQNKKEYYKLLNHPNHNKEKTNKIHTIYLIVRLKQNNKA